MMTSLRVPNTMRAGEAPEPAHVAPLPATAVLSSDRVPPTLGFRDGAETVVWCARPAGPGSFRPEDARYVQDVRRFTTSHMRRWGVEGTVASAAELMASELLTNELQHGSSSSIRVRLVVACGALMLAVTGGGSYVPKVKMADPEDIGQRGLFLVDHLAHEHRGCWGVSADGTTWCVLGSATLWE
ncbi:ATP-binding protein [Streptomyces sp. R33]|uniref:ATP-binding protein n=1 Tax=Streptomyces sp. R33 TaxID=3238629 RepID=A0AB39YFJ0_9ACTN